MHTFRWLFLEILGFFSFFGVLLLRGDSYRLELMMCILTVISISAFCYVLSDLDEPFHGVLRVDLSCVIVYLRDLQKTHMDMVGLTAFDDCIVKGT